MWWVIFNGTLLVLSLLTWGQDIVFPTEGEMFHLSGSNPVITERIPVSIPDHCPKNMLLYPGDGSKSAWICDCIPKFLYFPRNNSCFEAYRQGPCPPKNYVVLPKGETIPICMTNPCNEDGLVPYNNTCHGLNAPGGPCAPNGVLNVNETTFEIECVDFVPFIVIDSPKKVCPIGSRRNSLGVCRKGI